jgi:hypothetical protein
VKDQVIVKEMGALQVKGRVKPIPVYELVDLR